MKNKIKINAKSILIGKKKIKDKELEPWQRVALRDLKDFAYPLQVNNEILCKK